MNPVRDCDIPATALSSEKRTDRRWHACGSQHGPISNGMKYLITLLLLATLSSPVFAVEIPVNNAGFVQSNIWYSKDPFYAGEKIRIYTVIFNGSTYGLTGAVEFLDNGILIGKTTFALTGDVRTRDLWVEWKATEGKHAITARLLDVVTDGPNGKQSIVLLNGETGKSERIIDLDPIAKEVQAKAQADIASETQRQALGKVEDAIQAVNSLIPIQVKEGVSFGVDTIEAIRIGEAYNFRIAKENKAREIEVIKAREQTALATGTPKTIASGTDAMWNTAEKPFAYVMLALLATIQYIFEWYLLFYGIILYVLYRLIKWIIHRVRDR